MKCSKAHRLINDYVDNLLDIKDIWNLKRHLNECSDCRELLNDFARIAGDTKELNNVMPSRDIWPEIKREVVKRKRAGRGIFTWEFSLFPQRWSFALSTLLVALILAPVIYFGFNFTDNPDTDHEKIAVKNFNIAEEHYQAAIKALETAIDGKEKELNPELVKVLKKNLAIIDDSIQICRAAVQEHPENPEANRFLIICYRKKIELLNEIKDLTAQS